MVTFVVDTNPPTVTLKPVTTPSNVTTPAFEGTATGTKNVLVKVYKGTTATGSAVATAEAAVSSGKWGPATSAPTLGSGTYTAIAEQESAIGNGPGKSETQTFVINTSPPEVTLNAIETPSKDTSPSFSGTASETEPVTVEVFEGSKAEGTPLQTVQAKVTSGKWGPVNVSSALKSGEYTAIATEPSSLGNQAGQSKPDTFVVDTSSPKVALTAPTSPSNDRTPSFTGTASANTEVVVHIYEGTKAEGTEVSKATATGTGGAWTSGPAGTPLASGKHTFAAIATQESPLGNPEGKSNVVTFVVNMNPPAVTLNAIETPSKNTSPSFSGTASETLAVTIKIYQGSEAKGTPFATAEAAVSAEKWGPVGSTTALPEGEYTAVASEPSSLGNAEGKSGAIKFAVVTKSPVVTLNEVESPSKNTTPAFSGTTNETPTVTVKIYKGTKAEGTVLETLEATPKSGTWSTAAAKKGLADGVYAAVATQPSSLGNPAGTSNTVTFVVDTSAPQVTLEAVPARSNDTTPAFSGTASESDAVTVRIYKGSEAKGTVVATVEAEVTSRNWSSSALSKPLANGEYTAQAGEPSSLGNAEGKSELRTFVVDTEPPEVTLGTVPTPSNDVTPSFSGTASESLPVTVKVYKGSKAEGSPVATAEGALSGGKWGPVSSSTTLSSGTYTAVAEEKSSINNGPGKSEPRTFVINTEPPEVTLASVTTPSNNTKPSFSGTASETLPVTVKIYKGSKVEGSPLASAEGPVSSKKWGSVTSSTTLPSGTYTAVAEESSSLGNSAGKSEARTFVINTEAPEVTLATVKTPSNDTTPSFSGTASESLPVTVKVYKGSKPEGTLAASVEGSVSGGNWGPISSSTTLVSGTYTAVAEENSSLGNGIGKSESRTFVVNTEPPEVTLATVKSPSNDTTPSFSGTASESLPVTVKVYKGSKVEGSPLATAEGPVSAGKWGPVSSATALTSGTYTAVAEEASSLGNASGHSATVTFVINTEPPEVGLNAVKTPSNNTKPSFSGTASESLQVTVKVYKGSKPEGTLAATAEASVASGKWGPVSSSTTLTSGTYTAIAEEPSSLGNATGHSPPVTFVINTEPPEVTLAAVKSPSNDTTPSFSGTASESLPVTVKVYKGAKPEGTVVATAEGPVSSNKWGPVSSSTTLGNGTYTAVAEEPSSLGNTTGHSSPVTFVINTNAPEVTLNTVKTPSNDTTPSFSGTASESLPVTVKVYKGSKVEGVPVATAEASVSGGDWGPVSSLTTLVSGTYTAVADEESSIGNATGESSPITFVINTKPPEVTLNSVTSPSNNTKPSFSGTASESLAVTVKIYKGSKVEGSPVATAEGSVSGKKWGPASSSTTLSSGTYTAVAEEESSLGNATGQSGAVTFIVNTSPPEVTIEAPSSRSKNNQPTFKGTASEAGTVTVHVYKGSEAKGEEAAKLTATVSAEGKWTVGVRAPSGRPLHGAGNGAERHRKRAGGEQSGLLRSLHGAADRDDGTPRRAIEQERNPRSKGRRANPVRSQCMCTRARKRRARKRRNCRRPWVRRRRSVAPTANLPEETYTAVASEPSAIGNAEGFSKPPRTFIVFTEPPTVAITKGPEERSKQDQARVRR